MAFVHFSQKARLTCVTVVDSFRLLCSQRLCDCFALSVAERERSIVVLLQKRLTVIGAEDASAALKIASEIYILCALHVQSAQEEDTVVDSEKHFIGE